MLVAVSSTGAALESPMDQRFGRTAFFVVIDTDTMEYEAMENAGNRSESGAGIAAAQSVAEKGVTAVITGNIGPNAMEVLHAAKIGISRGQPASVRENVLRFKRGELATIDSAIRKHAGKCRRCGPRS